MFCFIFGKKKQTLLVLLLTGYIMKQQNEEYLFAYVTPAPQQSRADALI